MLIDSHISITAANEINEICQPLFQHSDITLFKYIRVFSDGSYIILGNNAAFVQKFSALEWSSKDLEISRSHIEPGRRYHFLNSHKQIPSCVLPITKHFNTNFTFLITDKYLSSRETFYFSTQSKDLSIYDFFFNNIDFIEKFIFYFKDKASAIIKKTASAQRSSFPEPDANKIGSMVNMLDAKALSDDLRVNKYIFSVSEQCTSLSAQEMNSVKLLARGYTIKQIAQDLHISPRTVDYYLRCAREKLKTNNNRQLISIYWDSLSLA